MKSTTMNKAVEVATEPTPRKVLHRAKPRKGNISKEATVPEEYENKVFAGSNGHYYKVVSETTCKKVSSPDKGFVENLDKFSLPEDVEIENTKILHRFLKKHLDDVVLKRGYVYHKGFRMKYSSHGFEIKDMMDHAKRVNVNNFHNDFPTPEDVLNFLRTSVLGSVSVNSENQIVLKQGESLPTKTTTPRVVMTRLDKPTEERIAEFLDAKSRFDAKQLDHYEFRAECMRAAKISIRFKVDKWFNKFRRKEIKKKVFLEGLSDYFYNMDEQGKQKPQRQPKFKGIDFDEPLNLTFVDSRTVRYEIEGPSHHNRTRLTVQEPLHLLLCKQVLSLVPQSMCYLMYIAMGKLKAFDIEQEHDYGNYGRDIYLAYDESVIRESEHGSELILACKDFLDAHGVLACTERKYLKSVEKGDGIYVSTLNAGFRTTVFYTVLSTEGGVKVVSSVTGETRYLSNWDYVVDIEIKKKRK